MRRPSFPLAGAAAFLAACFSWAVAVAGPARPVRATFERGQWSIGANGGVAYFRMGDVNDFLTARNITEGTNFRELKSGWEASGDVRYGLLEHFFLGLEAGRLAAHSDNRGGTGRFEVSAIPILLIGGLTVDDESRIGVRLVGGLGVLASGRLKEIGVGEVSSSGFAAYFGAEMELRALSRLGVQVRGLLRQARVENPEGSALDLDFSGLTLQAGLRGYLH